MHIEQLQAKVDESKRAMDEIQQELDGVSETVVDDLADIAARAAAKLQVSQLESKYHAEVDYIIWSEAKSPFVGYYAYSLAPSTLSAYLRIFGYNKRYGACGHKSICYF